MAEQHGPGPALALVDELDGLDGYPWWHAARAELLARLQRPVEAVCALDSALDLPVSDPVRRHLQGRRATLAAPGPSSDSCR